MLADTIRTLFDYHYWANRRVRDCIVALTDEQFTRANDYSVGSMRNQVVHTMGAELLWVSRLRGVSPSGFPNPDDFPTPQSAFDAWAAQEADVRAFLAGLTDEQLAQTIEYRTTSGVAYRETAWVILMQLINHGTDHRAQILAGLHRLGVPTVPQDFIMYSRERAQEAT